MCFHSSLMKELLHCSSCRYHAPSVCSNLSSVIFSGENVEDAFLDTAKKIYQNIQDGRCVFIRIVNFQIQIYTVK